MKVFVANRALAYPLFVFNLAVIVGYIPFIVFTKFHPGFIVGFVLMILLLVLVFLSATVFGLSRGDRRLVGWNPRCNVNATAIVRLVMAGSHGEVDQIHAVLLDGSQVPILRAGRPWFYPQRWNEAALQQTSERIFAWLQQDPAVAGEDKLSVGESSSLDRHDRE